MRRIFYIIFVLLFPTVAFATDYPVTCSGTITSALQSAINSATDGDTVTISAGSCSSSLVSWTNKNITLQGAGADSTHVTGLAVQLSMTTTQSVSWRITGIEFITNGGSSGVVRINPNGGYSYPYATKGWRVDNNIFTMTGCTQNFAFLITGQTWGLIDNNTFTNAGNAIMMHGFMNYYNEYETANPGLGGYGWSLELNEGSDEAVYVEDNTFTMSGTCNYGTSDMEFGSRMVFRYNTVTNLYFQTHAMRTVGASGYRGGSAWVEVYNNSFNGTQSGWTRGVHIRAGTGVVYNNRIYGYFTTMHVDDGRSNGVYSGAPYYSCDGARAWDGNIEANGWPCRDQIGRQPGTDPWDAQVSNPLYVWNNGSDDGCDDGGSCSNNRTMTENGATASAAIEIYPQDSPHTGSIYDVINNGTTPKPGYTAYTYPHQLRDEATPANAIQGITIGYQHEDRRLEMYRRT